MKFTPIHHSSWIKSHEPSKIHSLKDNIETEILIIGAGVSGLTSAYLLALEGKEVTVIDGGEPNTGESSKTSAHLSSALDESFTALESFFGKKGSRLAAESHREAINLIEKIVQHENINCDFKRVPGYLFSFDQNDDQKLKDEAEASKRAGFFDLEDNIIISFNEKNKAKAIKYQYQAQFEPILYLEGLIKALEKMNVKIYYETSAEEVIDGEPCAVHLKNHKVILAKEVIVATNSPFNNIINLHTKQASYRSYIVAIQVKKDLVPEALYWDTEKPYHYLRVQRLNNEYDLLIVGGEDHKVGQEETPEKKWQKLLNWAEKYVTEDFVCLYQWSAQLMEPNDGLAFLGRNPGEKHVYIITGDSGHGLTHGSIGAMLIRDLIVHRAETPLHRLYDPARVSKSPRAWASFLKENINVAYQYSDYLTVNFLDSSAIKINEGKVIQDGIKKIAVFKDEHSKIHCLSAVCPHLGAIVHWNNAEKSWDCPCHGSRFDTDGNVLNGPSHKGLDAIIKK